LAHFDSRTQLPTPTDGQRVLSFAYAMLVRSDRNAVGHRFRPVSRSHHQPRYGRPALALDMMELFRSIR
jgi:CRISPR/Cas system-associated endonuclease Cas1